MPKSKNYSIRVDIEKYDFFIKNNPTLDTPQKILNNALDMFWWRHHLKSSVIFTPINPESYDAPPIKNIKDEPKQWNEPTLTTIAPILGIYNGYETSLKACARISGLEMQVKLIEADINLTPIEKMRLRALAKELGKEMYND